MTCLLLGPLTVNLTRDEQSHREYKVKYLVESSVTDGPANVLRTPGLPRPGSFWAFGADIDLWAWCRWNATIAIHKEREGDPTRYWTVELTFSSKPLDVKACKDVQIEDPLLEPAKLSGSFVKYQEEATTNRFGQRITNSAWEQLRGPQVEFDSNRPQIRIEQNVPTLELRLFASMIDCLNNSTLWGLPPRCIKLSNVSWERKFQGLCQPYYTRTLEFDIRYDGFDRDLLDEGTKVLNGHWNNANGYWVLDNIGGNPPDRRNPNHFKRAQDRDGNVCRMVLNGRGLPANVVVGADKPYISIAPNNKGHVITDNLNWLPLTSPVTPDLFDEATADAVYKGGDLAIDSTGKLFDEELGINITSIYVALVDDPALPPHNPLVGGIPMPGQWLFVGFDPPGLRYKGPYNPNTTYTVGDIVVDDEITRPGVIHVEKYGEANFLLLGIPLFF